MKQFWAIAISAIFIVAHAQAQEDKSVLAKIAEKVTINGDVQFRYEHSLTEDVNVVGSYSTDPLQSNFRVRRARLRADAKVTPKLTMTLRIALQEFSNPERRVTEYAYFNYAFHERFQIRVGQDKSPFSLEELWSSNNLPVIDRGPTSGAFVDNNYAAFQQGIMIHGKIKNKILPFNYAAGVYNGNGRNRNDNNNGKNFVGRIELMPIEWLQIGTNGQFADIKGDDDATAYGVDLMIDEYFTERVGILLMAEYLKGDNIIRYENEIIFPKELADYEMHGWYTIALAKFKPPGKVFYEIEVGGKYERFMPVEGFSGGSITQITPNVGLTFLKNNAARWQFNLIHTDYENEIAGVLKDNLIFVTQFQVRF